MAECCNNVFIITRDNRCLPGSSSEFQKCPRLIGQCGCEQCATLKSERSICSTWLNKAPSLISQAQPLLPIEPIVKSKTPISFINDMIRRNHRLSDTTESSQSLKSHEVRKFVFTCYNDEVESMKVDPEPPITQCFTVN